MRYAKSIVIGLVVVALMLTAVQARMWVKAVAHARSKTDKQNIEQRQPPDEMPGVIGMCLLPAAGVLASIPRREE